MMTDSRFVADPARLRMLRAERFVPWPLPHLPLAGVKVRDVSDPATWGHGTGGFVSNARFASRPGEQVIKRTNRATTRKWMDKFGGFGGK